MNFFRRGWDPPAARLRPGKGGASGHLPVEVSKGRRPLRVRLPGWGGGEALREGPESIGAAWGPRLSLPEGGR